MPSWDDDEPLPIEQLRSEAELLALIQHWRDRAERAEYVLRCNSADDVATSSS